MLYRVNKNWPNHFNKHDIISFLIKDLRSNAIEMIALFNEWSWIKYGKEYFGWRFGLNAKELYFQINILMVWISAPG